MTFKPAFLFLLSVTALSAAPRLVLTASSAGPVAIKQGANGATQTVQAYNAGTGSLNLTATSSATWLAATVGSLTSCSAYTGGCYPVNISLNTSSLAIGTYTEYLTLTDPNAVDSPQQIAVTVAVEGVPSSLSLYVNPTGGLQTEVQVGVYTSGTGATGAATTQSGGNWLQFLPTNSFLPNQPPFTIVAAVQSGQAAGTYNGTITISGSSVSSDNKTIPVTFTVTTSPIIGLTYSTLLLTADAGGQASGSFTLSNVGSGTLSVTGATGSASYLSATASGNTVTVTANAASLTAGVYHPTVTITSNAANNSQVSVPVELTVEALGTPQIYYGGIVNNADFTEASVAAGDVVAIFGDQFAPAGSALQSPSVPLATSLAGVQVLVNGTPAPLLYVSPGQINFQMPYEAPAGQLSTVQVINNSVASNTRSIEVVVLSPKILVTGGYGVILNNGDGSFTWPSSIPVPGRTVHPAKVGDTVDMYCFGLGQTTPTAITGAAPNGPPLPLQTTATATVTFGGGFSGAPVSVTAVYTGLAPSFVGLYQVNATIPPGVPTGNQVPVLLTINGLASNSVYLAISQ